MPFSKPPPTPKIGHPEQTTQVPREFYTSLGCRSYLKAPGCTRRGAATLAVAAEKSRLRGSSSCRRYSCPGCAPLALTTSLVAALRAEEHLHNARRDPAAEAGKTSRALQPPG